MNWSNDDVIKITLLGAVVILLITIYVVGFYFKKMKDAKADGELTEHYWDGIGEFKNDIPVGWVLIFMGLIVWGLWYIFVGYPLGQFSQIGQYNEEVSRNNEVFEQKWKGLSQSEKIAMGEGLFLVQCSQCHGINAEGIDGKAQDLRSWGKEEGIIKVITEGSKGLNYAGGEMTPGLLEDETEKRQVAAYVMQTFSPAQSTKYSQADVEAGKAVFDMICVTCHGEDGKGNGSEIEGFASDLTEYGDYKLVKRVLTDGKKGFIGKMPSFSYANFNDIQIQALAAYINSLKVRD